MRDVGPVALVTDDRLLDHQAADDAHPEAPERLAAIRDRLRRGPLAGVLKPIAPREAERRWLLTVHDEGYISRFEEAALRGNSFLQHPDNQICYDSYRAALLSAGGGLTGVDLVEAGQYDGVFCCTRPPGHHAERALAMGFCFLNNAAIAARYWQQAHGRKRILIVDWDAHHGNGIQNAFEEDPHVLYVSLHEHPTFSYPGTGLGDETGSGPAAGITLNVPLPPGADDAMLRVALWEKVEPVVTRFQPDAIVVAAGFDGHRLDDMSGLAYSTEAYGQLGRWMAMWASRFCDGRILSLLEGGYHLQALAESVEAYLVAKVAELSKWAGQ